MKHRNEATAHQTTVMSTLLHCTHTCAAMLKPSGSTPPRLAAQNTPVRMAPRMPPTPWMPKTSHTSSAFSRRLRPDTPHRHSGPAITPMAMEPIGPTRPAAGVMVTNPATAPEAAPSIEALPLCSPSATSQATVAAPVAKMVLIKASPAMPLAAPAEPALKPNQPTHSSEAPTMVSVRLCGGSASLPKPMRLPVMYAPTSPATAALMWTTVPPAKSSAPSSASRPPPQTMCAMGM